MRDADSDQCVKCPIGTYSDTVGDTCASCPEGLSTGRDGADDSGLCIGKKTSIFFWVSEANFQDKIFLTFFDLDASCEPGEGYVIWQDACEPCWGGK